MKANMYDLAAKNGTLTIDHITTCGHLVSLR
jgi:hypothetical protein